MKGGRVVSPCLMSDINEKWVCVFSLPAWKCFTKTEGKRKGEIAGLEMEQCTSWFLWVYQTFPPTKENHASHHNPVMLQYVIHDGQNSQADSTAL